LTPLSVVALSSYSRNFRGFRPSFFLSTCLLPGDCVQTMGNVPSPLLVFLWLSSLAGPSDRSFWSFRKTPFAKRPFLFGQDAHVTTVPSIFALVPFLPTPFPFVLTLFFCPTPDFDSSLIPCGFLKGSRDHWVVVLVMNDPSPSYELTSFASSLAFFST